MKKNDGYVIIYVVFVIIFICLIAAGTCTYALSNLKAQNAVAEQLQDRYTAESNVEQFMAEVCLPDVSLYGDDYSTAEAAYAAAKSAFAASVITADNNNGTVTRVTSGVWSSTSDEYKITVDSSCGSAAVSAQLAFIAAIDINSYSQDDYDENGEEITVQLFSYSVSGVTSGYLSYRLEAYGGDA